MTESTPRARGLSMPPEWAPHERTLMAWPCRREVWGRLSCRLPMGGEYAGVANAIAAFEPVTMVCAVALDDAAAREGASHLQGVQIIVLPIDDSWLRTAGRSSSPLSPASA